LNAFIFRGFNAIKCDILTKCVLILSLVTFWQEVRGNAAFVCYLSFECMFSQKITRNFQALYQYSTECQHWENFVVIKYNHDLICH